MRCTFKVYGPGMKEIYEFDAQCFNPDGWRNSLGEILPTIKDYIKQNRDGWLGGSHLVNKGKVRNVFDTLDNQGQYPVLFPVSSKLLITNFGESNSSLHNSNNDIKRLEVREIQTFGEYKVALERIDYTLVSKEKGTIFTEPKVFNDRICEVDFAVTDHYMIQRSPYGIGNKATTELNKYKLMNGITFMDQFFKNERTDAQEYKTPASIKSLFTTFKNKYQKLAKPVKGKEGLSKVPGKAIYFYEGTEEINALLKNETKQPFTLIASRGQNLTIK